MHTGKSRTSCRSTKPLRSAVSSSDWLRMRTNLWRRLTATIFRQEPVGLGQQHRAEKFGHSSPGPARRPASQRLEVDGEDHPTLGVLRVRRSHRVSRTGMLSGLAAMELKVWVDGIQRVVCGVSEQTTCQEVVIALAQAIGQTGRFVLVQRLREKERQLLPQECPVGAQATCGQFASDVQFVLRRTGPSLAGRPSSDNCPPPERCPIRASLPPKPRPALDREPRKALTFSLGCPGLAPGPVAPEPVAPVESLPGCCTDLQGLEQRVRRNAAELGQEAFWEQELRREEAREREGQARLQALSVATAEHAARLQALDAQARALEAELQLVAETPGPPSPTVSASERLRQDLAAQERQRVEVQGSLVLVGRALEAAEHALQAQAQELEELNRELRQCDLQQFIQQTGAALPPPPRPDGVPLSTQDLLPPAREEPLTGPPRSPALVSSLSPEIAPMRQNSWR